MSEKQLEPNKPEGENYITSETRYVYGQVDQLLLTLEVNYLQTKEINVFFGIDQADNQHRTVQDVNDKNEIDTEPATAEDFSTPIFFDVEKIFRITFPVDYTMQIMNNKDLAAQKNDETIETNAVGSSFDINAKLVSGRILFSESIDMVKPRINELGDPVSIMKKFLNRGNDYLDGKTITGKDLVDRAIDILNETAKSAFDIFQTRENVSIEDFEYKQLITKKGSDDTDVKVFLNWLNPTLRIFELEISETKDEKKDEFNFLQEKIAQIKQTEAETGGTYDEYVGMDLPILDIKYIKSNSEDNKVVGMIVNLTELPENANTEILTTQAYIGDLILRILFLNAMPLRSD